MARDRLVLGTLALAPVTEPERDEIINHFLDWGGVWLDTASLYGDGELERYIGRYRKGRTVKVSTKLGHFKSRRSYAQRSELLKQIRLQTERLCGWADQVLLHEADWPVWWRCNVSSLDYSHAVIQSSEAWQLLGLMAKDNGVRIGMSGNDAHVVGRLADLLQPDVVLIAKQYDLIWRNAHHLARQTNRSTELWLAAPFHQGWLFRLQELARIRPDVAAVAKKLESALPSDKNARARIAMAWLKLNAPTSRIVAGVASLDELKILLDGWDEPVDQRLQVILADGFVGTPMVGPLKV